MFHPEGPTFLELMRQALSSTERGYDLLAPKFDRTPFRTPEPVVDAMVRAIGGPASVGAGLDVCCGTGAVLGRLRPLCRERAVGLDMSEGMLDEARRQLAAAPSGGTAHALAATPAGGAALELVRGDALAMPFEAEFDVVTSAGAFGHVERDDEDRFVAGIARALRPGGRFVFATAERPGVASPSLWILHGFNAAMRVRNALVKPPFIMYYLTFLWPDVRPLLARHGLRAEAHAPFADGPFRRARVVVAHKSAKPPTEVGGSDRPRLRPGFGKKRRV
ncbi:MAG TPA: class I SAM-dependent methyltransferase, partial [Polyangiaceae bacterium]|nr:class I SAM-dependent methyltransferase [Polyangiaceae bacterium]